MGQDSNSTRLYKALSSIYIGMSGLYENDKKIKGAYMPSATLIQNGKIVDTYLPDSINTTAITALTGRVSALQSKSLSAVSDSKVLDLTINGNTISADIILADKSLLSTSTGLKVNKDGKTIKLDDTNGFYVNIDDKTLVSSSTGILSANIDGLTLKCASKAEKLHVNLDDLTIKKTSDGALSAHIDGKTILTGSTGLKTGLKLKKLTTATSGYAASYVLADNDGTQIGDTVIDIVKDKFLKSAEIKTCSVANDLFTGSIAGHKYLKFIFYATNGKTADATAQTDPLWLDVNEMFDSYSDGNGVIVNNDSNTISVRRHNGLEFVGSTDGEKAIAAALSSGLEFVGSTDGSKRIAVKANTAKAIKVTSDGVQAVAASASGLNIDSTNGLYVNIATASGLFFDTNNGKVGINKGDGLDFSSNKLVVKIDTTNTESFLALTSNGIKVTGVSSFVTGYVSGQLSGTKGDVDKLQKVLSGYDSNKIISSTITGITEDVKTISGKIGNGFSSTNTILSNVSTLTGDVDTLKKATSGYTDQNSIKAAITGKIDLIASPSAGSIPAQTSTGGLTSGYALVTSIGEATGTGAATDTNVPTEKAVRAVISGVIADVKILKDEYEDLLGKINTVNGFITGFSIS